MKLKELKESVDALQKGDEKTFKESVSKLLTEEVRKQTLNEKKEEMTYNKVFNAMAKYFDVDPKEVDNMEQDKKDDFYNKLDKCWDEEENDVPDGCPVDLKKYMD